MNRTYRNLYLAKIHGAIAEAEACSDVQHRGVKGTLREVLVRELFRPLLPNDIGLASGEVISASEQHSAEQDIVVFDRRILPPFAHDASAGIFPIESTLYTIEVKSELNATELKKAHDSASEMLGMIYLSGHRDPSTGRVIGQHELEKTASALLALRSDLTADGKSEVQRYSDLYMPGKPAIRTICVVGRGCWYYDDQKWNQWPTRALYEEVLGFIALIVNRYVFVAQSRRTPALGQYFTDQ